MADDVLDVDAAVAQSGALFIGLGNLGLECDHAFKPVLNLGHLDSFVMCASPRVLSTSLVSPSSILPRKLRMRHIW